MGLRDNEISFAEAGKTFCDAFRDAQRGLQGWSHVCGDRAEPEGMSLALSEEVLLWCLLSIQHLRTTLDYHTMLSLQGWG